MISESRGYPVPDGTEWMPGSEDVLHRKKHVLGVCNTIDHAIILILNEVEEYQ